MGPGQPPSRFSSKDLRFEERKRKSPELNQMSLLRGQRKDGSGSGRGGDTQRHRKEDGRSVMSCIWHTRHLQVALSFTEGQTEERNDQNCKPLHAKKATVCDQCERRVADERRCRRHAVRFICTVRVFSTVSDKGSFCFSKGSNPSCSGSEANCQQRLEDALSPGCTFHLHPQCGFLPFFSNSARTEP